MPNSSTADDVGTLQRALAGQYSIDREIGRGGMGVVYLAREVVLDRPAAIKVLPSALAEDADARERFLREARTAAKLFHPHIVPIYRVDHLGDVVFIAMGFVDGTSAGQKVADDGPLPISQAVRILRETAWALSYAHARGVIHRDIKPDNLLIERDGGRTFVTDFGIARVEGTSALTQDGQMFGSVSYMSPEQISGSAIDGRSDLYSLGVVAHVLLTGKLPFAHASSTAVLAMHLGTPAPPIASLVPGISPRLAAAIDRCLVKDPAGRHESVDAFAAALADIERPKELPPALRAWIAGTGMVDAGFMVVVVLGFVIAVGTEGTYWWAAAASLPYVAIQRSRQTRRLMKMGFGLDDMTAGLKTAIHREAEETASQRAPAAPAVARVLRVLARVSGWTSIVAIGLEIAAGALVSTVGFDWINSHIDLVMRTVMPIAEGLMVYAPVTWIGSRLVAELIAPTSPAGLRQREYGARLRFWTSAVGKRFAGLLRAGLRRGQHVHADQPTELVVGAAAAALFEGLPPDLRQRLPELPNVVQGLEQRAQVLRTRIRDLEGLAAQVHPAGQGGAADGRHRAIDSDLAATRVRAEEKLSVVVAALETIRLDLLRLRTDNASVDGLTANVADAAKLAAEIDLAIESRAAVNELLGGG